MEQTHANGDDLDAKWARVRQVSREQEADWMLGEEMLKDPEDRRIPVQSGTRHYSCRWPSDPVLRTIMQLEASTSAMHTLTGEQFDELRGAFADVALGLIHDPTRRDEADLRGEYGFERSRNIVAGVVAAYQEGARAAATFRGQPTRPRHR